MAAPPRGGPRAARVREAGASRLHRRRHEGSMRPRSLDAALDTAFAEDDRVLVERGMQRPRARDRRARGTRRQRRAGLRGRRDRHHRPRLLRLRGEVPRRRRASTWSAPPTSRTASWRTSSGSRCAPSRRSAGAGSPASTSSSPARASSSTRSTRCRASRRSRCSRGAGSSRASRYPDLITDLIEQAR